MTNAMADADGDGRRTASRCKATCAVGQMEMQQAQSQ